MTPDQLAKLAKLAACRMLPGTFDKRFVRDLRGKAEDYELSPKQAKLIERLCRRYRRQLGIEETKAK